MKSQTRAYLLTSGLIWVICGTLLLVHPGYLRGAVIAFEALTWAWLMDIDRPNWR